MKVVLPNDTELELSDGVSGVAGPLWKPGGERQEGDCISAAR